MRFLPVFSVAVILLGCGDDNGNTTNDNNLNNNNETSGVCGDGNVDLGETCDDGTANSDSLADACRTSCREAYCGDGVVDPGGDEICDDGGTVTEDGCDDTCQVELGWDCSTGICEEICGDNLAVGDETCDGSDLRDQDCVSIGQALGRLECDAACDQWDVTHCSGGYVCGDGTVDPGEDCDDGPESATCDTDCTPALCGDGTINATAGEACDDGNTDDGDNCAGDCLTGTCPTGSSCVEDPPSTWEGPVIRHSSAVGSTLPSCPTGYPTVQMDLDDGLQSPGSCGCGCGSPTGITCAVANLEAHNTNQCMASSPTVASLAAGTCATVSLDSGYPWFKFTAPAITGGSCPVNVLDNLQTPYFDDQIRVCGNAAVGTAGCSTGEVCAPDAGVGYESQRCIYIAGTHACPVGSSYSQQAVYYSGFVDGRTCVGCSCSTPTGSCGGSITFVSSCSGTPTWLGDLQANLCSSMDTGAAGVTYYPAPSTSCMAPSGTVQGSADGSSAVTFCCQP